MGAKKLIGYVRVSTAKQGHSGLGIEAQRETLSRFAAAEGFELVRVFVEVETGKGADVSDLMQRRSTRTLYLADHRQHIGSVLISKGFNGRGGTFCELGRA